MQTQDGDANRAQALLGQSPAGRPGALRRRGSIERRRLIERLDRARAASCITVTAPAGYGKTTLLADWTAAGEIDSAWVAIDWRHDNTALLVGSIAYSFGALNEAEEAALAPLSAPQPDIVGVVVPRLCDALAEREPARLVLDDLHLISATESLEAVGALARCLPDHIQLLIASREQPQIGLGRLRTERSVTEIGLEEMAMTQIEAGRLFEACGEDLDGADVELLHSHTEGWPVALYLAALRLGRADDASSAVTDFTGDDRLVADYVREELLDQVGEETLDFLIRVSILDRMSGASCDAILDRQGSAAELLALSHTNLLLVPLDNHDREYRLHALLRETLHGELERLGADAERELHGRAAEWYAADGDPDRAVEHAIGSADLARAGELIWASIPVYGTTGRASTLQRWLEQLSDERIAASPYLSLTRAVIAMTDRDGAMVRQWAAAGQGSLEAIGAADAAGLDVCARILLAVAAEHDLEAAAADLAEATTHLAEEDAWRALCCFVEGVIRHLLGDLGRARTLLEEGSRRGVAAAPSLETLCRSQFALLLLEDGDAGGAREEIERAMATVDLYALDDDPSSILVFAIAAYVTARRGDTTMAKDYVATAKDQLAQRPGLNPWYEAEGGWAIARALILLDEIADARTYLADAGRHARRIPEATVLSEWLREAWLAADAAAAERGRWPLTPAELRLLHLLTSHLSLPKIAEQLYVSPNTVKTQAQSIYRKFSVSSRAEAVAVARTAGLLGDTPPPTVRGQSPDPGDVIPEIRT